MLVPQPSDDPNDPLNWSNLKKNLLLLAISLAAFQSDFQTAVGIPGVALQSLDWNISPVHVNYAGNLNVLMKYVCPISYCPVLTESLLQWHRRIILDPSGLLLG